MTTILIADDDATQRQMLGTLIRRRLGHEVQEAGDGEEALRLIQEDAQQEIELVLLDLSMPTMDGFEVLDQISKNYPDLPVIILTGSRDSASASKAIRMGALDFISKPAQADRITVSIQNALKMSTLNKEVHSKRPSLQLRRFKDLIGAEGDLKDVIAQARKVAASDIPVHLCGETGVGKEVLAQAIHNESKRRSAAFVTVNCGAIPANLIESILFGHEKGAFTGAVQKTLGKFREANAGTIFLDEVAELPFDSQVKLLRVLQQKEVDPVGATRTVPVDVRILSATNKDLHKEVKAGRFREDLYYRLNVLPIHIPPLRERKNDLPLLIAHFLHHYSLQESKAPCTLSAAAEKMLNHYGWPGNIRQLENTLHRAVVLSEKSLLQPEDFSFETQITSPHASDAASWQGLVFDSNGKVRSFDAIETDILGYVLAALDGNYSNAADLLGVAKSTLYRKFKR